MKYHKKAKEPKVSKAVKKEIVKEIKIHDLKDVEVKAFDAGTNTTISTTPTVVDISALAQGVTDVTRVGNKIKPHELDFNAEIFLNAVGTAGFTADHTSIVRLIIFQDKQGNNVPTGSGTSAVQDVLKDATIYSLFNYETKDRYRILVDKHYNVPQDLASVVYGAKPDQMVRFKIPSKKLLSAIEYADTNGTLYTKGRLFFLVWTNSLATTQDIRLAWESRLKFTDA